jgi:hypothetical protein
VIAPPRRYSAVTAWLRRANRVAGGLVGDAVLYAASAGFAGLTAAAATLPPHVWWGRYATVGYAVGTALALAQLGLRYRGGRPRRGAPDGGRWAVVGLTWLTTTLVPMLAEASARADGRSDRAQDEVLVVEQAGVRLVHTGTPYLGRPALAARPAAGRLLGYNPYQPGMALFGTPRALGSQAWYTDARIWFAVVTVVTLIAALALLRRRGAPDAALIRAAQAAAVLPPVALALAVGGDDLPVLGLCLLALAYAAGQRFGAAGVAVGAAGALKLFAWPVAAVLLALAATRGRAAVTRYTAGAIGLPVLALIPPLLIDPGAVQENLVRFPLGHGLVGSPAASPLPGHLIAQHAPAVATGLLVAAVLALGWWLVRWPPRSAAAAAALCAWGLLVAILLLPATRFGYLLYPISFAAWVPALATPEPMSPRPPSAPAGYDRRR